MDIYTYVCKYLWVHFFWLPCRNLNKRKHALITFSSALEQMQNLHITGHSRDHTHFWAGPAHSGKSCPWEYLTTSVKTLELLKSCALRKASRHYGTTSPPPSPPPSAVPITYHSNDAESGCLSLSQITAITYAHSCECECHLAAACECFPLSWLQL